MYSLANAASAKVDIRTEKEDICILVEMVAGVGFAFDSLKGADKS